MFKPLHNYVLLERLEEETKTAGGIIIPDNAQESHHAVVLSQRVLVHMRATN